MGKSLENIYLSCNKLRRLPSLAGPEVHLSALTLLDLSQNPIEYLPASLFQLPKLETLILARCGLNKLDLPLEGVRPVCPALRRLDISHNNFTELPESLALMSSLEVLNVSSNNLTYFPRCIAEMGKLTEVWANSNRLAVLPEELPQSVQLLVANSNEVESVPRNWALPALTTLALAYNRLTKLYSGFFDAFPSLTSLDLSANRLSSMPRVSSPHLTSLRVAGNRLSDIALSQEALTGLVVLDVSHNNLSTLHNLSAATGLEVLNIAHNKLGTAIQLAVLPRTLVRVNVACCGINDELGSSSSSSSSSTSNYGDSVLSLPRLETLCAQGNNIKQIGFETISASKSLIFADLSLNSFSQSAVPAPIINNLFVRKTVCCSSADTVWGSAAYCNMRAPTPSCSLPVVTEAIAPGCTLYALYDCCGTDCKQVAASVAAAVSAHVRKGLSTKHPSVPALLAEAVRSANTLFSEDPMDPLQGCGALLVLVDSVASVVHTASLGAAAAAIVSNTSAKWLAQGQDPLSAEEYSRIHTADPNAFVTADGRLMGVFAGSRGLGCKILGAALSDEPVVGKTELGGDDSNSDDDEEEEKNEFIVMASERVWKMAPLVGFIGPFVVDTYKKTKRNASLTAASLRDWCLGSCADDPQNYASLATLVVPISRK